MHPADDNLRPACQPGSIHPKNNFKLLVDSILLLTNEIAPEKT
jgi:hypothetical protein